MKKLFLGVLMAVTAITSPLLMANTNDKNDQQEVINIYFARHGKTLLNSFDRVQGWIDSPLTKDGVQVAQYLGEGLKGIKFDRFYSSDAGRQRETMAVILKQAGVTDYHLTEMTGLREAFFGGFEGGYNVDMANAGAHTLGMTDSKIQLISLGQKFLQNVIATSSMLPAYRRHSVNVGISSQLVFFSAARGHLRQGEPETGYCRVCPEPA